MVSPSPRVLEKQRCPGEIPSVNVFLPQGLVRMVNGRPCCTILLGCYYYADESRDQLFIIVAGAISPAHLETQELKWPKATRQKEMDSCLIGSLRPQESHEEQSLSDYGAVSEDVVWLDLTLQKEQRVSSWHRRTARQPIVRSIHAPLACSQYAINVVTYIPPRPERMRYLSLEPMVLPKASSAGVLDSVEENAASTPEARLQDTLEVLIRLDPRRLEDIEKERRTGNRSGQGFRKAIAQLNESGYRLELLTNYSSNISNGYHKQSFPSSLNLALCKLGRAGRHACNAARTCLRASISDVSLVEVSAAARQLELRIGQLSIWPRIGYRLRKRRRKDHEPVSNLGPRYITLYNGVWLVLNDLIIGQAAGIWICDHHVAIAAFVSRRLSPLLVDDLTNTLDWLDNWPAGLKLNAQLSVFFREMFVGFTTVYRDVVVSTLTNEEGHALRRIVYLAGMGTRLMGLTMLISILVDLLLLLTLHWYLFYRIQQAVFRFFCATIISLFHLFRGKKRNPLRRNRTDSASYELDQLLLGTIFFTLLIFLWLTVAVYYLQFGFLRLVVVGIVTILQTGLALLNHLPLFALMLRLKEPGRLPGGVEMQLRHNPPSDNPMKCSYFELYNTPLTFAQIFRGYNEHLHALGHLPDLLWCLVIGRRF